MKNNKGYYGWIHSLKNASWEAKKKGQEMRSLQEEKARKLTDPTRIQKASAELAYVPPRHRIAGEENPDDTNVDYGPIDVKDEEGKVIDRVPYNMAKLMMFQGISDRSKEGVDDWSRSTPQSIAKAGGQQGVFTSLEQMKAAEEAARLRSFKGPIDAEPTGDVNAVLDDADDWTMADPETPKIFDPPSFTVPNYPLAAQARAETAEIDRMKTVDQRSAEARQRYEDERRSQRVTARNAGAEAEYEANREARQDSIEGIIDRMMRGKKLS